MHLSDYLVRAQQLVTLLVGQGRQDRQVKEAMRRVDWVHVQSHFTNVVQEGLDHIQKIPSEIRQWGMTPNSKESSSQDLLPLDSFVDVDGLGKDVKTQKLLPMDSFVEEAGHQSVLSFKEKGIQEKRIQEKEI